MVHSEYEPPTGAFLPMYGADVRPYLINPPIPRVPFGVMGLEPGFFPRAPPRRFRMAQILVSARDLPLLLSDPSCPPLRIDGVVDTNFARNYLAQSEPVPFDQGRRIFHEIRPLPIHIAPLVAREGMQEEGKSLDNPIIVDECLSAPIERIPSGNSSVKRGREQEETASSSCANLQKLEARQSDSCLPAKKRRNSPASDEEMNPGPVTTENISKTTAAAKSREPRTRANLAPRFFPEHLMEILSVPELRDILHWLPDGEAFVVANTQKFESYVLPHHFQQNVKYASFTRKLNRWGFRQILKGPKSGSFFHKSFCRDKPLLCLTMTCCRASSENVNKKKKTSSQLKFQNVSSYDQVSKKEDDPSNDKVDGLRMLSSVADEVDGST